jgi:hypothetical protein
VGIIEARHSKIAGQFLGTSVRQHLSQRYKCSVFEVRIVCRGRLSFPDLSQVGQCHYNVQHPHGRNIILGAQHEVDPPLLVCDLSPNQMPSVEREHVQREH